jgi:ATPase subunit of ABC transporter with duplicated ATPase domains
MLDEPTDHLDFLGIAALQSVLASWRGGLLIVSHDQELLAGAHSR